MITISSTLSWQPLSSPEHPSSTERTADPPASETLSLPTPASLPCSLSIFPNIHLILNCFLFATHILSSMFNKRIDSLKTHSLDCLGWVSTLQLSMVTYAVIPHLGGRGRKSRSSGSSLAMWWLQEFASKHQNQTKRTGNSQSPSWAVLRTQGVYAQCTYSDHAYPLILLCLKPSPMLSATRDKVMPYPPTQHPIVLTRYSTTQQFIRNVFIKWQECLLNNKTFMMNHI